MIRPKKTILLLDDDEMVLMVTGMQLEMLGYKVDATLRARDALAHFHAYPYRFDLVITDELRLDITGRQVARILLKIRSDIPIVICTGFSPECTPEMARSIGCRAYVMKPMSVANWRDVIRHALSRRDFYSKE